MTPDFSGLSAEVLAQRLVDANAVVQTLSADLAAARTDLIAARAEVAQAKVDVAEANTARNEALVKVSKIDAIASAKALEIVAAQGCPIPIRSAPGSSSGNDPASIRAQFSRMRPGSPEANDFFARHRKVLTGN